MPLRRRNFLFGSIGLGTALQSLSRVGPNEASTGEIVFSDQVTEGTTIVLGEISSNVDAMLVVRYRDTSEPIYRDRNFGAGDYVDYKIELEDSLTESTELAVSLYDDDGSGYARDTAKITVGDPTKFVDSIGPTLVDADPEEGFNYPYYLYAPQTRVDQIPRPLLVEPNNSGVPSDDFDVHLDRAKGTLEGASGRHIADEIRAPFLVPVLPRPEGGNVPNPQNLWRKYLKADEPPLARPDLQVISMAKHAREFLKEADYPIDEEGIMLNGFSQSADWVGLFTALHPEEVKSVSAGGVNGMPILPIEEANGYTLDYHVGVANVGELIGRPIDVERFAEVNQFYYMGELDDSDTLTYYHDPSLFEKAKNVYGRHMVKDRFPYAKSVYEDEGFNAVFRVYDRAGHTPRPAENDLVEFHQRTISDDDFEEVRANIGGVVPELGLRIEYEPNDPFVDEEITFDARRSDIVDGEFTEFEWEFTDETLTGPTVTRVFREVGGHNVILNAEDGTGDSYQTISQIIVGDGKEELRDDVPDTPDGRIEVSDQTTDGTYLTIRELSTNIDAELVVRSEDFGSIYQDYGLQAGDYADYRINLNTVLTNSTEFSVHLYPEGGGEGFGRDGATVTVENPPERVDGIEPTLVESNPEAGYNFPYFLYAPPSDETPLPLIVEPNNTGSTTDDFDIHLEAAEGTLNGGLGRSIADSLETPLIVPVFPRPHSEPVDWTHYVHALDRETVAIAEGPLERVDLQLLAMVENTRKQLDENGYPVTDDKFMLTGFSASGNFVERFVALHPSKVHSASAGGLNGMVTLPTEELGGATLDYHIGITNLEDLTGNSFNCEEFRSVPQFLYLGALDHNDTITYGDAWTGDDWRELALQIYGIDMQSERFPLCRAVHDAIGSASVFRLYENTGHRTRPAETDVVDFHERVLEGENIGSIRADLGGGVPNLHANIQITPNEPDVGEQVAFHATESDIPNEEISEVKWEVESDQTNEFWFSTSFGDSGIKQITLQVTTKEGRTYKATEWLSVGGASPTDVDFGDNNGDEKDPCDRENDVGEGTEDNETDDDLEDDDEAEHDDEVDDEVGDEPTEDTEKDPEKNSEDNGLEDEPVDDSGYDPGDELLADGESGDGEDEADDTIPGFGIGSTVAAIGGAGYVIKRRLERSEDED